jgi:ribosomal protein S18 acetylase RimI-like enzyme
MMGADDRALASAQGVVELAFAAPGTAVAPPGPAARDLAVAGLDDLGFLRDRLRGGLTAMAVAESADEGALAAGSHQPAGDVSEVMGVGTVPSARRRGIGAALTGRLVEHARDRGADLVFLSRPTTTSRRIYERLGFRRIGLRLLRHAVEP